MKLRIPRRMLTLLAVALVAGCASTSENAGAPDVAVEVQNDLVPPTSLTVWMVPTVGGRDMLGVVPPGATQTLEFNMTSPTGEYRLQAETTAGEEIWSYPFILSESDAAVVWDLSANSVQVN